MDEQEKSGSKGSGWAGYFQPLVLILLSGILAAQIPLNSKRPDIDKQMSAKSGIQLDGRLWMDPFDAPQRDYKAGGKKHTEHEDLGGQIVQHITHDGAKPDKVIFLTVLVDGGPYAESVERRRRVRYAVVSGLLAKEYAPEDRDHIRYLHNPDPFRLFDPQHWARVASQAERQMPEIIPYEWFTKQNSPDVLVLWVDENQISDKPLTKLRIIRDEMRLDALTALLVPRVPEQALHLPPNGNNDRHVLARLFQHYAESEDTDGCIRQIKRIIEQARKVASGEASQKMPGNQYSKGSNVGHKSTITCPVPSSDADFTWRRVLANLLAEWPQSLRVEKDISRNDNPESLKAIAGELKTLKSTLLKPARSNPGAKENEGVEKGALSFGPQSFLLQHLGHEKASLLISALAFELSRVNDIWSSSEAALKADNYSKAALNEDAYSFAIIGPASSDVLLAMVNDPQKKPGTAEGWHVPYVSGQSEHFRIYSPTASIPEEQLRQYAKITACRNSAAPDSSCWYGSESLQAFFDRQGIKFTRTNLTDDRMVDALVHELGDRSIDLAGGRDRVALVVEGDTLYAKALETTFREAWNVEPDDKRILTFSYFKGLDGEGAIRERPSVSESGKNGVDGYSSNNFDSLVQTIQPKLFEYAWGNDQVDYLRRIADKIHKESAQIQSDHRVWPIRAIGLMGSDVYDKLMVLSALRPQFPSAVFFTTELDARFFDGTVEREITRNLVVASGTGLNPGGQSSIIKAPPFRSGEQTVYFETVGQAVGESPSEIQRNSDEHGKVQLFEIGRTKAIDLKSKGGAPTVSPTTIGSWIVLVCVVLISGLAVCPWIRSHCHSILLVSALLCLAWGALFLWTYISEEPWADPFEGVSIWPSEFIRLTAVILGACFWFLAWRRESDVFSGMDKYEMFQGLSGNVQTNADAGSSALQAPWLIWLRIYSPLIVILFGMFIFARVLGARYEFIRLLSPLLPLLMLLGASLLRALIRRAGGQASADSGNSPAYAVYKYALLIFAVSMALVSISGTTPTPSRGAAVEQTDLFLLSLSVALFIGLLAAVLEIGLRLITKLRVAGRRIKEGKSRDLLTDPVEFVETVGSGTAAFFKLAYFPFIIAGLMLLSRSHVLDNWSMPVGLALVFVLCFSLLIGCTWQVRSQAKSLRKEFLKCIVGQRFIAQVSACELGAYGPVLIGPGLGGIAILIGSGGLPDVLAKIVQLLSE